MKFLWALFLASKNSFALPKVFPYWSLHQTSLKEQLSLPAASLPSSRSLLKCRATSSHRVQGASPAHPSSPILEVFGYCLVARRSSGLLLMVNENLPSSSFNHFNHCDLFPHPVIDGHNEVQICQQPANILFLIEELRNLQTEVNRWKTSQMGFVVNSQTCSAQEIMMRK